MKNVYLLLLLIFLPYGSTIHCQKEVISFTEDDGLLSNSIIHLHHDQDGFLWIASSKGLQRYDGNQFQNFTPADNKEIFENINVIKDGPSGNFFIGTQEGGLLIMEPTGKIIHHFVHEPDNPHSLPNNLVSGILFQNNKIWVSTFEGISELDLSTLTFKTYQPSSINSQERNWFVSMHGINDSTLITVSKPGVIYYFDLHSKTFKQIAAISNSSSINTAYYNLPNVWLGASSGLFHYNLETGIVDFLSANNEFLQTHVTGIIHDKKNKKIWASSFRGIMIVDRPTGEINSLVPENNSPFHLQDVSIKCIAIDHHNGKWIGTSRGGLNYLPSGKNNFHVVRNKSGMEPMLPSNEIISIQEDHQSNIWIGTMKGLSLFSSNMKFIQQVNIQPTGIPFEISAYSPYAYMNKALWLGTNRGYIIQYFPDLKNTITWPVYPDEKSTITGFCTDHDSLIIARIYNKGVFKFNFEKKGFELLLDDENNTNKLYTLGGDGLVLYKNHLLIGTIGSLDIYSFLDNKLEHHMPWGNNLYDFHINDIVVDDSDRIWICTKNGFYQYDFDKDSFKRIPLSVGKTEEIYRAEVSKNNDVWLSTSEGIFFFNPTDGYTRRFLEEEGIHGRLSRTSYHSGSNKILFGGVNGLTWFYPDSIEIKPMKSNLVLSYIKLDKDSVIFPGRKNKISFHQRHNNIEIGYACLDFAFKKYINYYYRLEGYDSTWQETKNTSAFYSDLSPGNYQFKLKARDYTGNMLEQEKILSLQIIPYWYNRTVFRIVLLLLAIVTIIISIFLFRHVIRKNKITISKIFISDEKSSPEINFVQTIAHEIRENLADPSFDVNVLATKRGISKSNLYKRLKEESGKTPHEFITTVKMEFAADLLKKQKHNVSEVAFKTGYSDIAVFSRNFKKYFGISPSKYLKDSNASPFNLNYS